MTATKLFTMASVCLLLLTGCGSETAVRQEEPRVSAPPRSYGDLPGYQGDPFAGFSEVVSIALPAEVEQGAEEAGEAEVSETASASGPFSVQIMALDDESTARGVAESAGEQAGLPAFVDREGRYWKVRIGAFPDRSSAAGSLPQIRGMGFEDAWVVRRQDG